MLTKLSRIYIKPVWYSLIVDQLTYVPFITPFSLTTLSVRMAVVTVLANRCKQKSLAYVF